MNPLRRIFQPAALLGLVALGAAGLLATAFGQTQGYSQKTKTIKVATLLLDADKLNGTKLYGQTAAPFAFYNLDRATNVKPNGWTFQNPYAPGAVTPEIRSRYAEIYGVNAASPPAPSSTFPVPAVGTAIDKRQGPYWTIRLSTLSDAQLANYDVLLIAPRYYLQLNSDEREKLRKFVDGGGVLWVDLMGAGSQSSPLGIDSSYNLPFALTAVPNDARPLVYTDDTSPVLNGIRHVTDGDVQTLNALSKVALQAITTPNSADGANQRVGRAEYARYRSLAWVGTNIATPGRSVISSAQLGDGSIVVTARGAAEMLNQGSATATLDYSTNPSLSNLGYQPLDPSLSGQGRAAARLAVNIASLGGNYRQPSGGTRKSSSASVDPSAPVLSRFTAEGSYGPGNVVSGQPNATPVTYKGYLVATVGNRIVVMDAIPGRDLDGDGDPDDGIVDSSGALDNTLRDVSVGKPLDVVWVSAPIGSGVLSAPVCTEVPEVSGGFGPATDLILVTDSAGSLHAFNLAQLNANNQVIGGIHASEFAGYPIAAPSSGTAVLPPSSAGSLTPNVPNPPTVHNGLAYIADSVSGSPNIGRVWVVDLTGSRLMKSNGAAAGGNGFWYVGGMSASGSQLPWFTSAPTIGEIPIADSPGGSDRVLYGPGVYGSSTQPGFVSLWLGAKNETPDSWTVDTGAGGNTLHINTRAAAFGQLPIYFPPNGTPPSSGVPPLGSNTWGQSQMGIHLTILDGNGNPLPASTVVTSGPINGGQGVINYTSALTAAQITTAGYTFRIDYSIDWGFSPTAYSGQIQRGNLLLPIRRSPSLDSSKRILGSIALTTRGTLHLIEATPGGNDGGSYFAIREDGGGRGQFRVVSRFTLYPSYTQSFNGTPGVTVPQVLEDADGVRNFSPFLSNPNFSNWNFAGGVAVRNGIAFAAANATRSPGVPTAMILAFRAEPETAELHVGTNLGANTVILQADMARSDPNAVIRTPTQTRVAGDRLNIDSDNGIIRIENLATVTRNEITDCLSESQPIGIGADGRSFTLRQPDSKGDRWSPLLWFGLWNAGKATSGPLVAGNEVFLPATTFLPAVFKPGFTGINPPLNGVIWSVDADIPTSSLYSVTLPNHPWITQQAQIITPSGVFQASPYYRMPQNRGVTGVSDWALRLAQTELGTSTTVFGVGGGDGVVAAFGDRGLYGLSRADFVVCDEGRLLKVDSSGNAIQNAFGGRFSGIGNGGTVSELRPLVRPVKAYPVGTNETLVVDAGSNRVMRIDDDGTVLRSLDRITLDPKYKPTNYRVNEPLTFKDPRDATTFEGYVYKGATEIAASQQPIEYWIRYLVADSGNGRLVELADRFNVDQATGRIGAPIEVSAPDPETGLMRLTTQVGVLVWQSPSLEQAGQVGDYYNSVSRVFLGSAGTGRYVYVAGIGRTRPTQSSVGLDNPSTPRPSAGGGGAVVVFDPLGGTRVFDHFALPSLAATKFLTSPLPGDPAQGVLGSNPTNTVKFDTSDPRKSTQGQANRPFSGVQAVTASSAFDSTSGVASVRVMVTDADAVYEFDLASGNLGDPTKDPSIGGTLSPRWMINEAAFTTMRGASVLDPTTTTDPSTGAALAASDRRRVPYTKNSLLFRPSYARRLDSGEVIVVNGYQGLMRDRQTTYMGEVVLLDGTPNLSGTIADNLGFTQSSVRFELPPLEGIRGLVSPIFADRR